MDELEKHFVEGVMPNDSCWRVLNWYRNLYYTHSDNTERGIMARAINELFMQVKDGGRNA